MSISARPSTIRQLSNSVIRRFSTSCLHFEQASSSQSPKSYPVLNEFLIKDNKAPPSLPSDKSSFITKPFTNVASVLPKPVNADSSSTSSTSTFSQSASPYYQHFLSPAELEFIFNIVPNTLLKSESFNLPTPKKVNDIMILSSPTLPAKPFSPQTSPTTSPTSILSEAAFGEIDEYHAMKRINTIVETLQKILSLSAANNEMTTRWNMQRAMEMFRSNESDTGSPEVQIALLTVRINNLESHLKAHTRDIHSRRGLTQMKSKRDKLLKYLKRESLERYYHCVKRLGL